MTEQQQDDVTHEQTAKQAVVEMAELWLFALAATVGMLAGLAIQAGKTLIGGVRRDGA